MAKKRPMLQDKLDRGFSHIPSQDAQRIIELRLDEIVPNPYQPRKHFDEEGIRDLAASIKRHGHLQPIAVQKRPDSEGYMIVAGERRFRALQFLARETVNAVVVRGNPQELALIENLQRENLKPLEEAEGLASLMESHGYTQEELAEVVGKSRVSVTETLRLNDLPPAIKEECRTFDIPKLMLLQVAREEGDEAKCQLWEDIKAGRVKTVRQAKERRQEGPKAERAKQSEAAQTISFGRSFVRRLEALSDEYLATNQADYAAVAALVRQLNERLEAARNVIGEPVEAEPEGAA